LPLKNIAEAREETERIGMYVDLGRFINGIQVVPEPGFETEGQPLNYRVFKSQAHRTEVVDLADVIGFAEVTGLPVVFQVHHVVNQKISYKSA